MERMQSAKETCFFTPCCVCFLGSLNQKKKQQKTHTFDAIVKSQGIVGVVFIAKELPSPM